MNDFQSLYSWLSLISYESFKKIVENVVEGHAPVKIDMFAQMKLLSAENIIK